jgi:glutaredoxin
MHRLRWLVLLFFSICALPGAAGVYKWTDAEGRIHYSDSAPPDQKAAQVKIKVNSITGPATVSAIPSTTSGATTSGPASPGAKERVRVYTTSWCGYCKQVKAHLAARRVPFDEIDVETSDSGRREFASIGGRGVPVVLVGSQRMDGFGAEALDAMLARGGY